MFASLSRILDILLEKGYKFDFKSVPKELIEENPLPEPLNIIYSSNLVSYKEVNE